jgi:predicted glycosyltransferase
MKVMFYVQHLLGIGHLVRASRIAAAFKAAGHEVTVVSGGCAVDGFPQAGIAKVQLPAVRASDQGFSALVQEDGAAADGAFRQRRADQLIAAFDAINPECLLIEAFPFARRQMRFELSPLLDHVFAAEAGARAMVVSSVRDILQPKGGERDLKTAELVQHYFDLVLVHGQDLSGFEMTFSQAARIAGRLVSTGLVGPLPADGYSEPGEQFDVVVSAGGGVVGQRVLETAIAAKPLTRFADGRWLVVTGPNLDAAGFDRLSEAAGGDVELRRFDPQLAARFGHASVAVSQAGYNTVADVLSAGCASVLVPFEGEAEKEQLLRAEALAREGRAEIVRECELDAGRLAPAIDRAAAAAPALSPARLDGAAQSVRLVEARFAAFRRGQSA